MVIMALDHTREFFTNFSGNPLDPQKTSAALFLTRWITHVCAPIFVFLAGTSIYLQQRRKAKADLARNLITRGLWLIIVELTLVHLVFNFHWQWNVQILEVIWAIGAAMIAMVPLLWLSVRWSVVVGTLLIAGHNLLDGMRPESWGSLSWLWRLLHVPGILTDPGLKPPIILVAYPVLPWIGVMALGSAFGRVVQQPQPVRERWTLRAGVVLVSAFMMLRWSNFYGDPFQWAQQGSALRTAFSFFNVQKYPPSLLFLLATLGLASLALFIIERSGRTADATWRSILQVYGQVPLFYFLVHIAVIHLLRLGASWGAGSNWRWWLSAFPNGGVLVGVPPGQGYDLPVVYAVWVLVVVLCYPVCVLYRKLRLSGRYPILSYL